jgi:hypothetical protein
VALSFADPDEEARYIVATAQALRGVAFSEGGVSAVVGREATLFEDLLDRFGIHHAVFVK